MTIESEIESARQLLDLEDDWDEEGAVRISPLAFERVAAFLRGLAGQCPNLEIPDINPLPSGGLDVSWRRDSNRARLLIMFTDKLMSWYGDLNEGESAIKGKCYDATNQTLEQWIITNLS